jgi:hypothetical protein
MMCSGLQRCAIDVPHIEQTARLDLSANVGVNRRACGFAYWYAAKIPPADEIFRTRHRPWVLPTNDGIHNERKMAASPVLQRERKDDA